MVFIAFFVYIFQKPLKQAVGTVIFSAMLFVAQIVGLLKEYDIAWPDSIGRFVEVLDITNFNMESLTPGCSGSESNYYSTYVTAGDRASGRHRLLRAHLRAHRRRRTQSAV
jgi:hypothetical protein